MKTAFTLTTFAAVLVLMISCSKEKDLEPSTQPKTYNNGGLNNSQNQQNNTGGNNSTTGKPVGAGSGGTVTLPPTHPPSTVAACSNCHKGGAKVPDWKIDELQKEEQGLFATPEVSFSSPKAE